MSEEQEVSEQPVEEVKAEVVGETSGAPKNFMIRCLKCHWKRITSGLTMDLADLTYIKPTCAGCGRLRRYRCPECGNPCPLKRIKDCK